MLLGLDGDEQRHLVTVRHGLVDYALARDGSRVAYIAGDRAAASDDLAGATIYVVDTAAG